MARDPPPDPLHCSVPGCQYSTPKGCPTWDLMSNLLSTHTSGAHQAPTAAVAAAPNSITRLERLPRPTFHLNMSKAQWDFTKMQWDAYISQGPVTAEQRLHQLQAACEKDLLQRIYDAGSFRDLNTEELFITQLKKLAVMVVHRLSMP